MTGSLHSWSDAASVDEVAIDLRLLNRISLLPAGADGTRTVDVEAGCTIDRLLDHLSRHGDYTLPIYGMVGKQTVAGAISTATHGSGRSSLSHYVESATVAGYDALGQPCVFEWSEGDELRAARCGVGCAGILLSVRLRVERDHQIEERAQWFDRLDDLRAQAADFPRHQFYLMPWSWRWYAQLRRRLPRDGTRMPGPMAAALRVFRFVVVDMFLNGAIRALTASPRTIRYVPWIFRRVVPMIAPSGVRVVDNARELQTMRHDLYRHIECELFVPSPHLPVAAAFVEWVLRWSGGDGEPPSQEMASFMGGTAGGIDDLRGRYLHDYPITFRRVLHDDTLISMTSGNDAAEWYSISLITYQRDHIPFLRLTRFIAVTLAHGCGARPHWGKICPLSAAELASLYPSLDVFHLCCQTVDPLQTFVTGFARRTLGFASGRPRSPKARARASGGG